MSDTTTNTPTSGTKQAPKKSAATTTRSKPAAKKAGTKQAPTKTAGTKQAPKAAAKTAGTTPKAAPTATAAPGLEAKVVEAVREVATTGLTLGMKAVRTAEQRREALFTEFTSRLDATKSQLEGLVTAFEARLAEFDRRIEAFEVTLDQQVARIEDRLPAQAAQLVGQAHHLARDARTKVRQLAKVG